MTDAGHDAVALDARDDVATALRDIVGGDVVRVRTGQGLLTVEALEDIAFGHKVALVPLAPGDPVHKYGEAIGEATAAIARGAHVHVHNLGSLRAKVRCTGPRRID